MNDLFIVDTSHPVAVSESLRGLADAVHGVDWLHTTSPPPDGSRVMFSLLTLWHACRYATLVACRETNAHVRHSNSIWHCAGPFSNKSRIKIHAHDMHTCDALQRSLLQPAFGVNVTRRTSESSPLVPSLGLVDTFEWERLASAWSSHSMHVAILTSDGMNDAGGGDPLRWVWLCSCEDTIERDAVCACACVQDTVGGCGSDRDSGSTGVGVACGFDADSVLDDDDGHDSGVRRVSRCAWTRTTDDGSTDGARRRRDAAWFEMAAHRIRPELPEYMDDLDDACACRCRRPEGSRNPHRPASANQSPSSKQTSTTDPHEARGVGAIVKALVQQNAGVSLFLRTIMCIAALLWCAHSMLVRGKHPSFIECRKS